MSETYSCPLCDLTFDAPDPEMMQKKIGEHWPVCPMTAPGAQQALKDTRRVLGLAEDIEQRKKAQEGN